MRAKYTRITPPTKVRAQLRAAVIPVLLNGAHRVETDWKRAIPHDWPPQEGRIPGNTAKDIRVNQRTQTTVVISTGTIAGKSLETGAKAHVIRPRGGRGSTLNWPAERGGFGEDGAWRVRKVAHHPGVRSRSYGLYALLHERATILRELIAAVARLP